jgi:methylenetetrahydrofolate reductase (NADPH)
MTQTQRIADLLGEGPTYSVELMPPRTDEMLQQLEQTLQELKPLKPSFCSVTYGAGGSTRERTVEAVMGIHRDPDYVAMPHLTCVGQTKEEIERLVRQYADAGIVNLLALAGDPPRDGPATGDFRYATELIELARGVSDQFSIGVSAFPEVHPQSPDRATDRKRLAEKLRQADFGITQFFWNADHYFRMVDELTHDHHCDTPVVPSVFPILNAATAYKFTVTNGAEWPTWLAERFEKAGDDPEATRRVGVDVATEIAQQLIDRGVPGLHVYTMNRATSATEVWANLGLPTSPE